MSTGDYFSPPSLKTRADLEDLHHILGQARAQARHREPGGRKRRAALKGHERSQRRRSKIPSIAARSTRQV